MFVMRCKCFAESEAVNTLAECRCSLRIRQKATTTHTHSWARRCALAGGRGGGNILIIHAILYTFLLYCDRTGGSWQRHGCPSDLPFIVQYLSRVLRLHLQLSSSLTHKNYTSHFFLTYLFYIGKRTDVTHLHNVSAIAVMFYPTSPSSGKCQQ